MKSAFDSDLFKNNLQAMKARFPDLYKRVADVGNTMPFDIEIVPTPAGQVNVIATTNDGSRVPFYQERDIFSELREKMTDWQLDTEDFLFCVGLGLGYLPLVAMQTFSSQTRIVVIEPNLEILRLALQALDLSELFTYERLDLHVGPELNVADIIGRYGEQIFFGKNRLVSHGPSRLLFGDAFKALETEIIENIHVVRNIGYTAKHGGTQIFANTMDNLSSLLDGPDLASLAGRFNGCPAVCVAAGPSLDKDLAALKTIGNRALIICGDSAVRSLVEAGIRPHIVVTTDMNQINFEKMRTSLHHLDEAVLVFSIESNPDNVGSFSGRRKIAVTARNAVLNNWLGPAWSMAWRLPAMTSVSHTALFTAIGLGAGPIILVGMDFAYSAGKSHASGSVFRYPVNPENLIEALGVCGLPVYSLPQLSTDRKQIENVMTESKVRFIDCSLDGALIRGAENRSLQEVVDTMLADEIDVSAILEEIDWQPKVGDKMAAKQFTSMQRQVAHFLADCTRRQAQFLEDAERSRSVDRAHLRSELKNFERSHAVIVSILKIVRYGDIKQTTAQLNKLAACAESSGQKALEIYTGIYASLHRAGKIFEEKLQRATDYFVEQQVLLPPIGQADVTEGGFHELADHYLSFGCTAKAAQTLIDFLDKKNDDGNTWLKLVGIFVDKRIWSLADRYAERMCQHCPEDPRVLKLARTIDASVDKLLDDAIAFMDAGAVDDARRNLFEYHGLRTPNKRSLVLENRIERADRENEEAMCDPEVLQLSAEQATALNNKAQDCKRLGMAEEAVGIFEGLAMAGGQAASAAREAIGDIRLSHGDMISAVWHYKKALEGSPGNIALEKKLKRASESHLNGNLSTTKAHSMKQNETISPASRIRSPQTLYQQAQQLVQQEKVVDAIATLEQLLNAYPDFALAHNDLAVLFYNQGKTDQSLRHYREAVRLEPQNPVFQKNLADFYYFINQDIQPALAIYVDLLENNPEDQEVLLVLGQICMQQEKMDDAAVFFQRVLELEPTNSDAQMGLAVLAGRQDSTVQDPLPDKGPQPESAQVSPSPIVDAEIATGDRRFVVKIPKNEMFRIKSIFENNEYAILTRRRQTGGFKVFDVGANVGVFALYVHAVHPESQIYCFEPGPLAQELLETNIGSLPGMNICKFGLFNRDMAATMHIHRYNTGQNSIRFDEQHHDGTASVQLLDAGRQFDDLGLSHLDVLKIDTEGCEVEILESMGHRLEKVDYVLVEYHTEKDRRTIDELMKPFHLFGANAVVAGVGTVKYVHPDLVWT